MFVNTVVKLKFIFWIMISWEMHEFVIFPSMNEWITLFNYLGEYTLHLYGRKKLQIGPLTLKPNVNTKIMDLLSLCCQTSFFKSEDLVFCL